MDKNAKNAILRDISERRFGHALIRLWLLAESTQQDGTQTLSRWLHRRNSVEDEAMLAQFKPALEKLVPEILPMALDHPIALIVALDEFWGTTTTEFPLMPGGLPEFRTDGDRRYWLVRRRNGGDTPADLQNPNLERWFSHFRVIPDRVIIGEADIRVVVKQLAYSKKRPKSNIDTLRIRVSHFDDNVTPEVEEDLLNTSFSVTGLRSESLRGESLGDELAAVRKDCVDIWLAPELSVSPNLRDQVASWLLDNGADDLLLCVPGSFHEMEGGEPVNRVVILDGNGIEVARQHKLSQFSYRRDDTILHERILTKREIVLLITPIGLIGVAICKDYCDATASSLIQSAWDRLAPDWLLVPSMGDKDTLDAHTKRASEHWKLRRTRSAIANQQPTIDLPQPGFVFCDGRINQIATGGSTYSSMAADDLTPKSVPAKPRLKRIK